MAISLNGGTGVITGVSVGGLPDGIVDSDMLAASAVSSAKLPAGSIVQVAQAISHSQFNSNSTSFTNTGLITLNFSNTLQSGSKVLACIDLTFGESYSGNWGYPHYFTLFAGTSGATGSNVAHATYGMGGANAMAGAVDSSYGTQYDLSRFSARDFHTPPNTNPYYRLFVRTGINTRSVHIGENGNDGTIYEVGGTIVTIMEVAA